MGNKKLSLLLCNSGANTSYLLLSYLQYKTFIPKFFLILLAVAFFPLHVIGVPLRVSLFKFIMS